MASTTLRVVGSAAISLRPLRYLLDVETNIQVITEEGSTASLPVDTVHVHVRAATRPPLLERDQLLNGFLRSETPLPASQNAESDFHRGESNSEIDAQDCKDECLDEVETLESVRGMSLWLLIRLQPLAGQYPSNTLNGNGVKEALRVHYQITPSSESFCLPLDHTNIVKLLVTDELLNHVNAKLLQFTFLSVLPTSFEATPALKDETKSIVLTSSSRDTLAASEVAATEEARQLQQVEAELAKASYLAQVKEREHFEAQLQVERDFQRARELELARREQDCARSLLEEKLATREHQNEELKQVRKQLEDQLLATNESAQRFQVKSSSTDQALEMLKQRAISDAKEREELQCRLRVLEEEKLALLKKSRACSIQ